MLRAGSLQLDRAGLETHVQLYMAVFPPKGKGKGTRKGKGKYPHAVAAVSICGGGGNLRGEPVGVAPCRVGQL